MALRGGWLHSGDLGTMDAEGYLTVTGRQDNLIVSGGENIQPEEVEAALMALPEVAQAVVVPVADEEFGQRPVAFLRFEEAPLGEEPLRRRLVEQLARFKIPKVFYPWPADEPPGMKVYRKDFEARAQRQIERDTELS